MTTSSVRWQDWAGFALGLWLAVSPWIVGYDAHVAPTANAVFIGLALALACHFEASVGEAFGEWLNLGIGLWLIAAPFLLGFHADTVATAATLSVGTFVAVLAASALSLLRAIIRL